MRLKILLLSLFLSAAAALHAQQVRIAIVVSANAEWQVIKNTYPNERYTNSVYGEFFFKELEAKNRKIKVLFFHQGWGKVAAAAATQYVIQTHNPKYIINLGTCGGFEGSTERFSTILADKTVIYDIKESMGDAQAATQHYSTQIDLTWLGKNYPVEVLKGTLVSADGDLQGKDIARLTEQYQALAADWESGAIAYIAQRNKRRLLILRGVSDLVSPQSGEAYHNEALFKKNTEIVMKKLLAELPLWLERCR
jgi:adenosylhomocysteine nucleosidase